MDSLLRDLDRERSKMLADIENLNRHYEKLAAYVSQYTEQAVIEWAKLVGTHPYSLLLVVETTRLIDEHGNGVYGGGNEPIRLTVLSLGTGQMRDQLIRPTHSRQETGTEYHGLTMADLADAPQLAEVWPTIGDRLRGCPLVIFGADYARAAVQSVLSPSPLLDDAYCLHNKAKEYYGEFYDLSLEKILSYQGIDKKREELKDSRERVQTLAQVVRNLAAGMKKPPQEDDDHPF